ncbi:MAG: MarR family transcriptional regulator [Lachnospiraceae bacterium]|nr:MarR family transcriptional regulator [Lachnospiraceae bacterium]
MKASYRNLMLQNHLSFQKKVYDRLSKDNLNLSIGQPKIFDFLLDCDECMQKDIALGCQIEPASVTSVLLQMEQKGYIVRRNKDGNRRSLYVSLTEEGQETAKKVREIMEEVEKEALNGISSEEFETLISILNRVNENLIK